MGRGSGLRKLMNVHGRKHMVRDMLKEFVSSIKKKCMIIINLAE
jgi:hypothetical protein